MRSQAILTIVVAILTAISGANSAWGFPDLVRHNYVNCNACHVAPTGGGVLNAYGRSMSREVLSTWGGERESEPLHGLLPPEAVPEWLMVGGDVRGIQIHRESPERTSERWMMMQATIELAVRVMKWTAVMSVGRLDPRTNETKTDSTRFFVMYDLLDELSVRVGRFTPSFGVNTPYHTSPTRQGIGFAPGSERETVETALNAENWSGALSVSRTPVGPVGPANRESMVALQIHRQFASRYKIGASYLTAKSDSAERDVAAVHGLMGFTEKFSYQTEFDLQRRRPTGGGKETKGLFHFSQLQYEVTKGVNLYLMEDYEKSDLDDSTTLVNSIGPGVRWFPRPHFEFDLVFLKRRIVAIGDRYDDFGWLLAHYYF